MTLDNLIVSYFMYDIPESEREEVLDTLVKDLAILVRQSEIFSPKDPYKLYGLSEIIDILNVDLGSQVSVETQIRNKILEMIDIVNSKGYGYKTKVENLLKLTKFFTQAKYY